MPRISPCVYDPSNPTKCASSQPISLHDRAQPTELPALIINRRRWLLMRTVRRWPPGSRR